MFILQRYDFFAILNRTYSRVLTIISFRYLPCRIITHCFTNRLFSFYINVLKDANCAWINTYTPLFKVI